MKNLFFKHPFIELLRDKRKAVLIVPKKGEDYALRVSKKEILLQELIDGIQVLTKYRFDLQELSQNKKLLGKKSMYEFVQKISEITKEITNKKSELFIIEAGGINK